MRLELRIAGFGGQGVIKMALLTAKASGLYENKEVAQTQSYGPEARGGACKSDVVVSDEPIEYIKPLKIDFFVVMSQPAMDRYSDALDPARTVLIKDQDLVTAVPPGFINIHGVSATDVSEKEFGVPLFANIVMLGAVSAITGIVRLESLNTALDGNVPPKTLETNRKALKRGFHLGLQSAYRV